MSTSQIRPPNLCRNQLDGLDWFVVLRFRFLGAILVEGNERFLSSLSGWVSDSDCLFRLLEKHLREYPPVRLLFSIGEMHECFFWQYLLIRIAAALDCQPNTATEWMGT
jgi:hypothetical protein